MGYMKSSKYLPSTVKPRPWPLPDGFRYLESGHKAFRILNGRFVPIPLKTPNLLVSDLMYHYYYVTRDQLVPLEFNYGTGKAKPAPERAINLHKTNMNTYRFEYYCDASTEWRWRLRSANGEIVADSSEGYKNKKDMLEEWHNITTAIGTNQVTMHDTNYEKTT